MTERLALAHLPTPIQHFDALDKLIGLELWIKRDDANAGAAAGNKIRKLEFLLAEAIAQASTHVITCGDEQSNHARATALLAAQLGLHSVLLLRTKNAQEPPMPVANTLLDRLAGARIIWVSPEDYEQRDRLMAQEAGTLATVGARAYVIPEGGSNGLGAQGYVEAMRETRQQLDLGLLGSIREFDSIVVPCGTGGTAAGTALGASHHGIARQLLAMAVCATSQHFREAIDRIIVDARAVNSRLSASVPVSVLDDYRGSAYGVATPEQLEFIALVARTAGVVLDPVYTGKALFGLSRLKDKPQRALFIHTGGLPGALAQADALASHAPCG
jgi:D-cysteine desulfhydrase